MSFIYIFLGGGIGSLVRFMIGNLIPYHNGFPWATFISNLLACFLFGLIYAQLERIDTVQVAKELKWLLLVGFCGGFSTFSTFSFETIQLIKSGQILAALAYIFLSTSMAVLFLFWGLQWR